MDFGTLAVISAAGLAGPLLAGLGRRVLVPVMIGELAAGIALGETGLGVIDPHTDGLPFLADVGFAMLMLSAGMHIPLRSSHLRGAIPRGAVAAGVVAALAVAAGLAIAAIADTGHPWLYAVIVATGSAAVVVPALEEQRVAKHTAALVLMAQITVADIVTVVLVPLVVDGADPLRAALGVVVVAAAAVAIVLLGRALRHRRAIHRFRKLSKHRAWAVDLRMSLLVLFALAFLAQEFQAGVLIAGFVVGLMVAAIGGPKRLDRQVTGVAAGFFVPLFFVVLGARLELDGILANPAFLIVTGLLVASTLAAHLLAAVATRQRPSAGLVASAQLGVPIAIVTLGLESNAIDQSEAGAILIATLVSIAISTVGTTRLVRALKHESGGAGRSLTSSAGGAGPERAGAQASEPSDVE